MLLEAFDMQVHSIINFVLDEQPDPNELLYQGLTVDLVVREGLRLELLRGAIETAIVVGEIQRCDEE